MKISKKNILMALTMCSCISFGATAFAKVNMDITWANVPALNCSAHYNSNVALADDDILKEIGNTVDNKLRREQSKLPFNLKTVGDGYSNSIKEANYKDNDIVILPLVQNDNYFNFAQRIEGVSYAKAVLTTVLNITFCKVEGNNLKLLHIIPLSHTETLGVNGEYRNRESVPIADIKYAYLNLTKRLINEALNFGNGNYLKNFEAKAVEDEDTYQVVDVDFTAGDKVFIANVPGFSFEPNPCYITKVLGESVAKDLVALAYTSGFAERNPNLCVLPSKYSGAWYEEAGQRALATGAGGYKLIIPNGKKPIAIKVTKSAFFEKPVKTNTFRVMSLGARLEQGNNYCMTTVDRKIVRDISSRVDNGAAMKTDEWLVQLLYKAGRELAEKSSKR